MRPSCLTLLVLCLLVAGSAHGQVLISEVYYCHGLVDDGYEWVEFYNPTLDEISLDGYTLAHGGFDYSWTVVTFGPADVIPSCGTFVVGGPESVAGNSFPVLDKVVNFDGDLQNGGVVADGVALFAPGADIFVDTPLDAVLYGDTNPNGLLDETGVAGTPDVASVTGYGQSIMRTSIVGNWVIQLSPDPNRTTFLSEACEPIPVEVPSWSHLKSRYERGR